MPNLPGSTNAALSIDGSHRLARTLSRSQRPCSMPYWMACKVDYRETDDSRMRSNSMNLDAAVNATEGAL